MANTGKLATFSRYGISTKLFGTVGQRSIQKMVDEMSRPPASGDVKLKLWHVGMELARNFLVPVYISVMRTTAADALNFLEFAQMATATQAIPGL